MVDSFGTLGFGILSDSNNGNILTNCGPGISWCDISYKPIRLHGRVSCAKTSIDNIKLLGGRGGVLDGDA